MGEKIKAHQGWAACPDSGVCQLQSWGLDCFIFSLSYSMQLLLGSHLLLSQPEACHFWCPTSIPSKDLCLSDSQGLPWPETSHPPAATSLLPFSHPRLLSTSSPLAGGPCPTSANKPCFLQNLGEMVLPLTWFARPQLPKSATLQRCHLSEGSFLQALAQPFALLWLLVLHIEGIGCVSVQFCLWPGLHFQLSRHSKKA